MIFILTMVIFLLLMRTHGEHTWKINLEQISSVDYDDSLGDNVYLINFYCKNSTGNCISGRSNQSGDNSRSDMGYGIRGRTNAENTVKALNQLIEVCNSRN